MEEFYIKQGATQPILVMKVDLESRFTYEQFNNALENSTITFSMVDTQTGIYKIAKKRAGFILKENLVSNILKEEEYYIYYKFTSIDTNRPGKYKGEFKIEFYDTEETETTGTFLGPIKSDLTILIQPSLFTETNKNNK